MGKTLQYVKEFDFSTAGKAVGHCDHGKMKGYAKGGAATKKPQTPSRGIMEKATKEVYPSRRAMQKHETMESPRERREELLQKESVKAPRAGLDALKMALTRRRQMPVAPAEPMIAPQAMKTGGKVKKQFGGMLPRGIATPRVLAARPIGIARPVVVPAATVLKSGGKIPKAGAGKIPKVMHEFKAGELHSGSKKGPVVKSNKQAIAIALSEARKAGKK